SGAAVAIRTHLASGTPAARYPACGPCSWRTCAGDAALYATGDLGLVCFLCRHGPDLNAVVPVFAAGCLVDIQFLVEPAPGRGNVSRRVCVAPVAFPGLSPRLDRHGVARLPQFRVQAACGR